MNTTRTTNNTNQATENLQTTLDNINTLARSATAGTLKRIYTASANDNIRKLQQALQADYHTLDNANGAIGCTLSDAYDLHNTALTVLYDYCITQHLNPQDTLTFTLKNGDTYDITVFQAACKAVSKEVYANKALNLMGGTKTHTRKDGTKATYKTINKQVYIEDLGGIDEDGNSALEREYIRINGLYDIDQYTVNEQIKELLNSLNLTPYQEGIVKMRMQGLSVTTIGEKLGVSQQAISKQLAKIQAIITDKCPELIRHFKGQRNH